MELINFLIEHYYLSGPLLMIHIEKPDLLVDVLEEAILKFLTKKISTELVMNIL